MDFLVQHKTHEHQKLVRVYRTFQTVLLKKNYIHRTIEISDLAIDYGEDVIADYFGIASGRNEDKFSIAGLKPIKSGLVNALYVKEFPLCLEFCLLHTAKIGSRFRKNRAALTIYRRNTRC